MLLGGGQACLGGSAGNDHPASASAGASGVSAGRPTEGVRIVLSAEAGESAPTTGATVAVTLGDRGGSGGPTVVVVHVAEGSDAQRSGVQVGDELAAIDGAPPRSLDDARARLSGRAGTDVLVELKRGESSVTLRLLREAVRR